MRRDLPYVVVWGFMLVSCYKGRLLPIEGNVRFNLIKSDTYTLLYMETEKWYPNFNLTIEFNLIQHGKTIKVELLGVYEPHILLPALGPARGIDSLTLTNGLNNLLFTYGSYTDYYAVQVDTCIHVIPIITNFTVYDSTLYGGLVRKPNIYLYVDLGTNGWCVSQPEIISFLQWLLPEYGFNPRECDDFIQYWGDKLMGSPYYEIYPITLEQIDLICPMKVSPAPDNVLRLWLYIVPTKQYRVLAPPDIPKFTRDGFVVTEWGVIIEE
ncbi:hypothetical protein CGW93_03980 [candidate division bacterium WOR-3 4484_18]|uniref:Uncharacterized protein n=1 Tax=candidate division WOR-3 bacterium 4484_18 TaxID=2020626 RepID=A0A257LTD3_UNCW3|nr:MAG: hypothetical protein CGW93_03980 [candidate division bacterium WOR-3 4484_18]